MRKAVSTVVMLLVLAGMLAPAALASLRARSKSCCPDGMAEMKHDCCPPGMHDMDAGESGAAISELPICCRHVVSTIAPAAVPHTSPIRFEGPRSSHPVLDEFAPLLIPDRRSASRNDRAPPRSR